MDKEKIYVGLDIGTNSVGWAVTDENYHVIRKGGKPLQGVRLVKNTETAETRRTNRSSRRRLERRRYRLELLQEFFSQEINKIDPMFFMRLNNSQYFLEDKSNIFMGKYTLFNDTDYNDVQYHRQFPTIYHLRQYLVNINKKPDIRFVFLACHNIIKYRGNFLIQEANIETQDSTLKYFIEIFESTINTLNDNIGMNLYNMECTYSSLERIINNIKDFKNNQDLYNDLSEELNSGKEKYNNMLLKLISGYKIDLSEFLSEDSLKGTDLQSIKFSDSDFDENIMPVLADLLEEKFEIIINAKKMYDWFILRKLIGNKTYISQAMIDIYNKHKKDLKILKKFYKKYMSLDQYNEMFRKTEVKNNYVAYVQRNQIHGKKEYVHKCDYESFLKYLEKHVNLCSLEGKTSNEFIFLSEEIKKKSLLPKLKKKENSVIPYQLNLLELNAILSNTEKYYTYFAEKDETGISISDKIKSLLTFRIPYYVGPLNDYHKNGCGFAWVVRKEKGRVTPWNFSEKVDINSSAKEFINKMTKKCTYLIGKDVLPKHSLLYSEFRVLNELNKITINGYPITKEDKDFIIEKIFKKYKNVKVKQVQRLYKREGKIENLEDLDIKGIDGDFKNSLSSYIDFTRIFGKISDENYYMIERIIFLITVFEDKKRLVYELKNNFNLSEEQIKVIKGLTYFGWGRLSRELLNDLIFRTTNNGEIVTLMDLMREENMNLQEALFDTRYKFMSLIEQYNLQNDDVYKMSYDDLVKDLYVSPSVKTSIWQSVKIVEEIKKILKIKKIDKFFVECTRENRKKTTTSSRRKFLEDLLKKTDKTFLELKKMQETLNSRSDDDLKSDKLFLYFLQLGRCMYTDRPIDLDKLFTSEYDIDHIIPRAYLKDNSLSNRVLVFNKANKAKSDKYPIDPVVQNKMGDFWKQLVKSGLISKQKLAKLTRKNPLTDEEIGGFINRQLVFTNQTVKSTIEIIKKLNPKSTVIYSKAGNVSDFRNKFGILKCREINDFHHADDAYLNIIVGNVFYTKFGLDARVFIKNQDFKMFGTNTDKIFNKDIRNAWDAKETIKTVKKEIFNKNKLVSNMTYISKGKFYDETVYPKDKTLFPIKTKSGSPYLSTDKYGGYKSLKIAYFVICKSHDKKNKEKITIEGIPVIYDYMISNKVMKLVEVLTEYNKLINPEILVEKIKINTLVKIDKTLMYLSGKSSNSILVQNANQMYISQKHQDYLRLIIKHEESYKKPDEILHWDETEYLVVKHRDKKENDYLNKEKNYELYNLFLNQLEKPIYKFLKVSDYVDKLRESEGVFKLLNVRLQARVLRQVMHLLEVNSTLSDLGQILENASKLGNCRLNKNITELNIKIIDKSVTGFYSRTRWSHKNVI